MPLYIFFFYSSCIPQTSTKTAKGVLERYEASILRRSRLNREFMLRYIQYPNIMSIYERFLADKINEHSKFYYVGKTERKYSGYSAEGSLSAINTANTNAS